MCVSFSLGEMKRELTVHHGAHQLAAHQLHARVVGQLEIVDARHHRRQVGLGNVARRRRRGCRGGCGGRRRNDGRRRVLRHGRGVGGAARLAHNGERRHECAEAADGQARTARHELQEASLLVGVERAHDLEQVLHGLALVRVAVVAARALGQRALVPRAEAGAAEQALELVRLREAAAHVRQRQDGLEALDERVHLGLDAAPQRPLGQQRQVVGERGERDERLASAALQLDVRVAGQREVEVHVDDGRLELAQLALIAASARSTRLAHQRLQRLHARMQLRVHVSHVVGAHRLRIEQTLVEGRAQRYVHDAEVHDRLGGELAQQLELVLHFDEQCLLVFATSRR